MARYDTTGLLTALLTHLVAQVGASVAVFAPGEPAPPADAAADGYEAVWCRVAHPVSDPVDRRVSGDGADQRRVMISVGVIAAESEATPTIETAAEAIAAALDLAVLTSGAMICHTETATVNIATEPDPETSMRTALVTTAGLIGVSA